MNLTISQTSIRTWKTVRRHYFMLLGGAVLVVAATAAGVGALRLGSISESSAGHPPAAAPIESGFVAHTGAPVTYYLVDSEQVAVDWATRIEARSGVDDSRYFLAPGMEAFDEALEALDRPWLDVNVIDLRSR